MKDPDKMSERELRAEVKSWRLGDRKITDYTMIGSCDMKYLVESVAEHIADGWQPFGGVCLAYERNIQRSVADERFLPQDFEHYAQAFVRYE